MPVRFVLICASMYASVFATTQSVCYDHFGAELQAPTFAACDDTAEASACCLLIQSDGGPADICVSSGLCLQQDINPDFFYQVGCTDASWDDPACPHICANSSQNVVQSCDDGAGGTPTRDRGGTWCCRADGEPSCCDNAFTTSIGTLLLPTATATSTTTLTATVTQSTTSSVDPREAKGGGGSSSSSGSGGASSSGGGDDSSDTGSSGGNDNSGSSGSGSSSGGVSGSGTHGSNNNNGNSSSTTASRNYAPAMTGVVGLPLGAAIVAAWYVL